MDLIASTPDDILVPLGITLPNFLAAYKAANQLQGGIPTPTVDFNFQNELNRINGTPQLAIEDQPTTVTHLATGKNNLNLTETLFDEENNLEQEMMDASTAVETAAIGGRAAICRLIRCAFFKGTIEPIQKIHLQRKENDKTKWIKAAFTLPCLNKAAQRVATIIVNEPPAQMPVLFGLVQETATKTTSAMEHRIQSLEDQLKAVSCNTKAKKVKGDGTKKKLQGILKNKGTPVTSKESAPKKSTPKKSTPKESANAQGARNNDSKHAKGKKKQRKRSISFDGKNAGKATNLRK